jgi:hypothetical protein
VFCGVTTTGLLVISADVNDKISAAEEIFSKICQNSL